MNKKHFFFWLAVVAACVTLFSTCKKDKEDYRDKWVGTYDFIMIDYYKTQTPIETTIEIDTIYFIGTIEKHKTDKLKIVFKPDAMEPFPIEGIVYPTVDDSGVLSYPDYIAYLLESYYFVGNFSGSISENTIIINYKGGTGPYGPLGSREYHNHDMHGTKINKK